MIQTPPGKSFTEDEAHTMCKECQGSLAAYGHLDLWVELALAHAGKPSPHKVAKKATKKAIPTN